MSALPKPTRKKKANHSRKKATNERRQMEIELEKLLSAHVIQRDRDVCNWCGKTYIRLFGAHVLPKGSNPRLRFEPFNIMALCYACHLGNRGWHKDPMRAREWFEGKYPGRYERLQIAASCAPKVDLPLLLTVWRDEVKGVLEK